MFSDAVLSVLFGFLNSIFGLIPAIDIVYNKADIQGFFDFLHVSLWVLPNSTVAIIVGISITLTLFRVAVATLRTIFDITPIL